MRLQSMKTALYGLFILAITSQGACIKPSNSDIVEKKYDVSYGSHARNKMDVYLPANRNAETPFIMLLHGGAWVSGDKADMRTLQEFLLAKGIASASMNYRYASSSVHFGELMNDVNKAVEYCAEHADAWVMRKDHFVIGGASAGAHMSLLYGYQYDPSQRIAAIISAAGPTDITDISWLNHAAIFGLIGSIESMTGATYVYGQPLPPQFAASSPLNAIKNIPTLMIHGDADVIVFYSQAQSLTTALQNAGIPHKLITLPGANHDMNLGDPATFQHVMTEIEDWILLYGK